MALPLCFCPDGVARPAWTRNEPVARLATAGGGVCYHGGWKPGDWKAGKDGWHVLIEGHRPQHLIRAEQHPRIPTLIPVQGLAEDHVWAVPVLIRPLMRTKSAELYEPAVDRIWRGGDLQMPEDLGDLVHELLQWAAGAPTEEDGERRLIRIAARGVSLTHHVNLELIDLAGWMSLAAAVRIVRGMCGLNPDKDPEPAPC
jgi:hypothetical protein